MVVVVGSDGRSGSSGLRVVYVYPKALPNNDERKKSENWRAEFDYEKEARNRCFITGNRTCRSEVSRVRGQCVYELPAYAGHLSILRGTLSSAFHMYTSIDSLESREATERSCECYITTHIHSSACGILTSH
jgi:hypothetical protein